MATRKHKFNKYTLDPIPQELWREAKPLLDTKLGFCEECGFYHVDPYPPEDYLIDFYTSYEMPTPQQNLSETARLLAKNLDKTSKVIDVGCGDGSFLLEMNKLGFENVVGLDQSPGIERAMKLGFGEFYRKNLWEFLAESEKSGGTDADAIVMVNVLEHVAEPIDLLDRFYNIMPKNSLLTIAVPNDFSPLQNAFLKVKGHLPWFVHVPDHLNYFDFETLKHTLSNSGFGVIDQQALFPLELFLLQDLDYIENPDLGPVAHQRRVMFEDNMKAAGMTDVLDKFYEALAAGGFGRDAMVVARKQ